MKQLSINHISAASIRANRKTYVSLAVGIVLSVVLATVMTLCAYGIVQAREQKVIQTVGYTDCILLDEPDITGDALRGSGLFDQIGQQFVVASVKDSNVFLGYTDETGQEVLCRSCVEGRLPEAPGEIAIERSALEKLRLEAEVGDSVTWTLLPVDGVEEEHRFTIVGILKEQTSALDVSNFYLTTGQRVLNWPAALISSDDCFATGRVVVHRVMTYSPLSNFSRVEKRWFYGAFFGVSRTQAMAYPNDPAATDLAAYTQLTGMLLVLGLALLLAVCIGISSAMEGVLSAKTEEIGMLRAVGATKRQIRRIFGRDAWLLSLIALPLGLLVGLLAAWIVCSLSPNEMVFAPRVWLILPVIVISALCIAVASGLPLRRASKQMPMGVLRDTALLRKAASFQSKQSFRATELIAARQLRIHPWRQLGAALMVMATLICTAFVGEMGYDAMSELSRSHPVAFTLTPYGWIAAHGYAFAAMKPENQLSEQDVAQIRNLPQVAYASFDGQTDVNLIFNGELPEYFQTMAGTTGRADDGETVWEYSVFGGGSGMNYLALTDDDPEPPEALYEEDSAAWYRRNTWEKYRQMRAVMEAHNLSGKPIRLTLFIIDLSQVDFTDGIAEGKVDLAAIDAGEQVLVYAPTYYVSKTENGDLIAATYVWNRREALAEYHNDYFYAGQRLDLTQLLCDSPAGTETYDAWLAGYAQMERNDATVTVGAVLDGKSIRDEALCLLTTEAGARALGFPATFVSGMQISLTGDVDRETEEALEARLERIAMRGDMRVYNWLQSWREEVASMKQAFALFIALLLLFFTVAVAMQVGNAGRRIRSDARMIGTLRAVGADEKALLGCYRLPLLLTTGIGTALGIALYLVFAVWYSSQTMLHLHPYAIAPAMLVLAALCALCCLEGLKMRLKTVLDQSIVENIREL